MKLNKILLLTILGLGLSLTTTQTVRGSQAGRLAMVCKNLPKDTKGNFQACSAQSSQNIACCNVLISTACQGQPIQDNTNVKKACGAIQQQVLSQVQDQYPELYNMIMQGQQKVQGGTVGQSAQGQRTQNVKSKLDTQLDGQ